MLPAENTDSFLDDLMDWSAFAVQHPSRHGKLAADTMQIRRRMLRYLAQPLLPLIAEHVEAFVQRGHL